MNTKRFGVTALTLAVAVALAPSATTSRLMFFKPYTPSETEVLQKATSLAVGNLAWESVTIIDIRKTKTEVTWTGKTRSINYACKAQLNGEDPFCDRP